jgi:hypothetical protein
MTARFVMLACVVSVGTAMGLTACSSYSEQKAAERPSSLQSTSYLASDQAVAGAWTYRSPQANLSKYRRVMIDPVTVYSGPEANFKDIAPADQAKYATAVSDSFSRVLREKYQVVGGAAPDVLRIHVTLLGVQPTVGGVATVSRALPVGLAVNAVRAAQSEGGTMTGGIDLAVEFFDSQTGEVVAAAVRHIEPGAFNLEATMSTSDTVNACADEAATKVRDALDKNLRRG